MQLIIGTALAPRLAAFVEREQAQLQIFDGSGNTGRETVELAENTSKDGSDTVGNQEAADSNWDKNELNYQKTWYWWRIDEGSAVPSSYGVVIYKNKANDGLQLGI